MIVGPCFCIDLNSSLAGFRINDASPAISEHVEVQTALAKLRSLNGGLTQALKIGDVSKEFDAVRTEVFYGSFGRGNVVLVRRLIFSD